MEDSSNELTFTPGELIELDFPLVCDSATNEFYESHVKSRLSASAATPQIGEYTYFITLTCMSDLTTLLIRLKRILKAKMFEINYAEGCLELTKAGRPHAHLFVRSNKKYLDKNKLTRSNKDIVDLQRPQSEENVLNYIKKETTKPPLDYLIKYGVSFPHFKYTNKELIFFDVSLTVPTTNEKIHACSAECNEA